MIDNKDFLYKLFDQHIKDTPSHEETEIELVRRVVFDYWQELQKTGFIADIHSDEILEDLEAEVTEILRKTIYGHFSLKSFRDSKKSI